MQFSTIKRVLFSVLLLLGGIVFESRAETIITSNIDQDTTWTVAGSPYRIQNHIYVSNQRQAVTLTVEAGVQVVFEDLRGVAGNPIDIGENAALIVQGTTQAPVLFTNVEPDKTQASTGGVRFLTNSRASDSVISGAIFEQSTNAIVIYSGSPTIQDSIFRYNDYGIWIEEVADSEITVNPVITNDVFQNHRNHAVYVRNADAQINSNRFENNGSWRDWNGKWVPDIGGAIGLENANPAISNCSAPAYDAVSGVNQFVDIFSNFDKDLTWNVPGTLDGGGIFPYFIRNGIYIGNSAQQIGLTVSGGVTLVFGDLRGVAGNPIDIGENAALIVQGTTQAPVLFTNVEPDKTQASTGGVRFLTNSRASDSVISGAIFEQAGGAIEVYAGTPAINDSIMRYSITGVHVGDGANPQISNCSLMNNKYGVYAVHPGVSVKISGSIIENNTDYGVFNATSICIDARHNFWGNPTGPLDNSEAHDCVYEQGYAYHNPEGTGNMVSDNVIYDPWNRSNEPCTCADDDSDGTPNAWDDCPNTPADSFVDRYGCASTAGGKIGLEDAIHALQVVSGIRTQQ